MKNKISATLVVPLMAVLGLGIGAAAIAGAQSVNLPDTQPSTQTLSNSTNTATDTTTETKQFDHSKGGHVGKNGVKEEVLTGDLATKATAAALATFPGGTIERVETDAEGAVYEAHMTKADGSHVTVKFDSNFTVTATEDGHGSKLDSK